MSPPPLASRVCTLTFILTFLALVGGGVALGLGHVHRSFTCGFFGSRRGFCCFGFRSRAGFLLGGARGAFLAPRQRRNLLDRGVRHPADARNLATPGLP